MRIYPRFRIELHHPVVVLPIDHVSVDRLELDLGSLTIWNKVAELSDTNPPSPSPNSGCAPLMRETYTFESSTVNLSHVHPRGRDFVTERVEIGMNIDRVAYLEAPDPELQLAASGPLPVANVEQLLSCQMDESMRLGDVNISMNILSARLRVTATHFHLLMAIVTRNFGAAPARPTWPAADASSALETSAPAGPKRIVFHYDRPVPAPPSVFRFHLALSRPVIELFDLSSDAASRNRPLAEAKLESFSYFVRRGVTDDALHRVTFAGITVASAASSTIREIGTLNSAELCHVTLEPSSSLFADTHSMLRVSLGDVNLQWYPHFMQNLNVFLKGAAYDPFARNSSLSEEKDEVDDPLLFNGVRDNRSVERVVQSVSLRVQTASVTFHRFEDLRESDASATSAFLRVNVRDASFQRWERPLSSSWQMDVGSAGARVADGAATQLKWPELVRCSYGRPRRGISASLRATNRKPLISIASSWFDRKHHQHPGYDSSYSVMVAALPVFSNSDHPQLGHGSCLHIVFLQSLWTEVVAYFNQGMSSGLLLLSAKMSAYVLALE